MARKITTEEFVQRAIVLHGNKFDYSNSIYVHSQQGIEVKCGECGWVWHPTPANHLKVKGGNCPKCSKLNLAKLFAFSFEDFVNRARAIHGDRYEYDKKSYSKLKCKCNIYCSIHGVFEQRGEDHLEGNGCPKCAVHQMIKSKLKTKEMFIEQACKIHLNKYTYEKSEYIDSHHKVLITCPTHGDFNQLPHSHLAGVGCPKCNFSKLELSIENILKKGQNEYVYQYKPKGCRHKGQLSFDFYIEDKKVCIECQGKQHYFEMDYFKGKKGLEQQIIRDQIKRDYCKAHGLHLIEVPYFFSLEAICDVLSKGGLNAIQKE